MKEFKISDKKEIKVGDDLILRRTWNGSEMEWHLLRCKHQRLFGSIELSNEEAKIVVAKIQKVIQDEEAARSTG